MEGENTPTLFTQDDTGNYVEYTPPEPPAFHETLPEDIRENEYLKDVKDNSELARYYVDLKSNWLKPPDTPDGYEFEKPENYNLDEETYNAFRKQAHEVGLNQKQFDAVMKTDVARYQKTMEDMDKSIADYRAESETALKTEWGENYEKNLDAAKRVLNHEKIADDKFKHFLEETRFGDNPEVVKFFYKLSQSISEDTFIKPGTGGEKPKQMIGEDGRPMLHFPSMIKK